MKTYPSKASLLALLLAGLVSGCGGPEPVPEAFRSDQEAQRAEAISGAQVTAGSGIEQELWRIAREDPNEFLRARALEQLYTQLPGPSPDGLPEGAAAALQQALGQDPDLNRRFAALLQIRYRTVTALTDAAQVHHTTRNPKTRRALEVGGARMLGPQQIQELRESRREAERSYGEAVDRVQQAMAKGEFY